MENKKINEYEIDNESKINEIRAKRIAAIALALTAGGASALTGCSNNTQNVKNETKVTNEKSVEKKVVEAKSQALLDKPKATAEKMVSGKTESAKLASTKVETEKTALVKEESHLADKAKPAKNAKASAKNESSKTAKSSSKDSAKSEDELDENAMVSSFSMEELRLGAQRSPTKDEIQHLKRQCRYAYMTEQDVIENNCSAKKVNMAR